MEKKNNNSKKIILSIVVTLVIMLGLTYALFQVTLSGTKEQVLTSGTLELALDESASEGINLSNAGPVRDDEGKTYTPYTFTLQNTGSLDSNYKIYLDDEELTVGQNRMPDNAVKYSLIIDGQEQPMNLVSTLGINPNRILDSGGLSAGAKHTYTLRVWMDYDAGNDAQSTVFKAKLRIVSTQKVKSSIERTLLAHNEAKQPITKMFNYSSEGKQWTQATNATSAANPTYVTNGLYQGEDDDGVSYYFRGNVNNIVKFGTYEKDYYVYHYGDYDFPSLAACQYYNRACAESNKTLKYTAGTPMYWKIIRTNGDGTTRMIYAGAGETMPTTGVDTGIGISNFNGVYNDVKYTGYTYDSGTASPIKTEIDNWYATNLASTTYDSKIATATFCADSSGKEIGVWSSGYITFANFQRGFQNILSFATDNAPTFKCPTTTETYGGKYNLKVGLITSDDVVAAGGLYDTNNSSYYLYNNQWYWTMTPAMFLESGAYVWRVYATGPMNSIRVNDAYGLVRPVINLSTDVKIINGSGTTADPYIVE